MTRKHQVLICLVGMLSVAYGLSACRPSTPAAPGAPAADLPRVSEEEDAAKPQAVDEPAETAAEPTGPPTTREEFETWNLQTSPNAPQDDDDEAVVEAVTAFLLDECEVERLALIPCPDYDHPDMPPTYYERYEGDELAVYIFQESDASTREVMVGPPEACAWFMAYMEREGDEWVVQKTVDPNCLDGDGVTYERGKGFIERDEGAE